jgi:hypothetical protein
VTISRIRASLPRVKDPCSRLSSAFLRGQGLSGQLKSIVQDANVLTPCRNCESLSTFALNLVKVGRCIFKDLTDMRPLKRNFELISSRLR